MSTNAPAVVGLDVAKAKVDVALLKCGKFKSKVIDNSPAGFAALIKAAAQLCQQIERLLQDAVGLIRGDRIIGAGAGGMAADVG